MISWSLIDLHLPKASFTRSQIGPGAAIGLITIAAMTTGIEMQPGYVFDLRHAFISASGLLFGPVSAVVSGMLAGAFRFYQGGVGMAAEMAAIASSVAIGSSAYSLLKGRVPNLLHSTMFAVLVGLGDLFSLWVLLPDVGVPSFGQVWLPHATLTLTGIAFVAFVLSIELSRRLEYSTLELYREMVDALPDCLNAKDLNGKFIVANQATARLMKAQDQSDLIGKSDFDFYPEAVAAGYRDDELSVLQSNMPQRLEQLVDFKDGEIGWLDTVKIPFRNKEGNLIALITYNRDTTEFHKMNEMKEQFISTVSHEIRTPLTSICGALRLLNHDPEGVLPDKVTELIDLADRNAQHLVELINNVLDLEKFHAGEMDFTPETIDAASVAEETIESMRHFLPHKELTLKVTNMAGNSEVHAQPVRLRQVLLNLLSNAAKFAPPRSIVDVEITRAEDVVRVCVLDSGPGVDPDFEAMLFSRFTQEKATAESNAKNGTGLGLSLIKSFVEHMSGSVSYRRRGDRTEFRIDLPSSVKNGHGAIPITKRVASSDVGVDATQSA